MYHKQNLKEVTRFFLRLGFTAFGGPAVHIAMMRDEAVMKRKWMSEQHFLDLLGATNLIPGPNSTEMAIHIGRERAGWRGLVIGGLCFIMPAVLITFCFAWLYKAYGQLPQVQPFIYGIKPAIIAVILAAIYPLALKSVQTVELAIIGIFCLTLCFLGISQLFILFGSGFVSLGLMVIRLKKTNGIYSLFPIALLQTSDSRFFSPTNIGLFLSFLKIGAILYGSGYVLFAFLDTELVKKRYHLAPATDRCHCRWAIHTGPCVFIRYFYRLPGQRYQRRSCFHHRYIFTILPFCRLSKSIGSRNARFKAVWCFLKCSQCSFHRVDRFRLLPAGPR